MRERHHVQLIGAFELRGPGGRVVARLRAKERALLGHLLLEPDNPRPRAGLAQLLWPDLAHDAARNNLRVALSRIRRSIGDAPWLRVERDAVWAVLADVEVDVHALLDGAAGTPTTSELLPGLQLEGCEEFNEWLMVWRERVRVATERELERAVRAALDRSDTSEAGHLARQLLDLDPLLEVGHELLARTHVQAGDERAALEQLRQCEVLLSLELGVAPSARIASLLAELEGPGVAPEPVVTLPALPVPTTSFHGRSDELAHLDRVLRSRVARIVTIAGPGGVGKTRLALEAATHAARWYQDGACMVSLTGVERPEDIPAAVADALQLRGVRDAADPGAELVRRLVDRDVLVLLDNAEHVIDAVADVVRLVTGACAYVSMLVTSREPLTLHAEDVVALRGLPYPRSDVDAVDRSPAVRLFLERAHLVDKTVRLDATTIGSVVEICWAVEGQPLGLEIAAAALRGTTLPDVARMLTRAPHELTAQLRDVAPEHLNLATVFGRSVDLLDEPDRRVLERLSVFVDGFTGEAAATVADATPSALARLARASLVEVDRAGRYRMHALVRQFAEAALRTHEQEARLATSRHATTMLGDLVELATELDREGARAVRDRVELEYPNIRRAWAAALGMGSFEMLVAAAPGLVALGSVTGRGHEVMDLLLHAADAARRADEVDAEVTLTHLGMRFGWFLMEVDEARRRVERALALAEERPHLHHVAARLSLTWAEASDQRQTDPAETDRALATARRLSAADDDPVFAGFLDSVEGLVACRRAQFGRAETLLRRAIERLEDSQHLRGAATALAWLAPVHAEQYDIAPALAADRAALEAFIALGNDERRATMELNVAASYILHGAWERAEVHTRTARAMLAEQGDASGVGYADIQLAEALDGLGRSDEATLLFEHGIGVLREHGEVQWLRFKHVPWARHLLRIERPLQAEIVGRDIVTANVEANSPHFEVTGLAIVARALLDQDDVDAALAAAAEVWERYGAERAGAGLPWPLETLRDVEVVFAAVGDERAALARAAARRIMRRTARSIIDPALRADYLGRVRAVQELSESPSR